MTHACVHYVLSLCAGRSDYCVYGGCLLIGLAWICAYNVCVWAVHLIRESDL